VAPGGALAAAQAHLRDPADQVAAGEEHRRDLRRRRRHPHHVRAGKQRWLTGIEAVIDKDLASELLAREVEADLLVIATDVDGVYLDWGKPP
jgi:uridylate kinase